MAVDHAPKQITETKCQRKRAKHRNEILQNGKKCREPLTVKSFHKSENRIELFPLGQRS